MSMSWAYTELCSPRDLVNRDRHMKRYLADMFEQGIDHSTCQLRHYILCTRAWMSAMASFTEGVRRGAVHSFVHPPHRVPSIMPVILDQQHTHGLRHRGVVPGAGGSGHGLLHLHAP